MSFKGKLQAFRNAIAPVSTKERDVSAVESGPEEYFLERKHLRNFAYPPLIESEAKLPNRDLATAIAYKYKCGTPNILRQL